MTPYDTSDCTTTCTDHVSIMFMVRLVLAYDDTAPHTSATKLYSEVAVHHQALILVKDRPNNRIPLLRTSRPHADPKKETKEHALCTKNGTTPAGSNLPCQ